LGSLPLLLSQRLVPK
jgi:hypothetical protein